MQKEIEKNILFLREMHLNCVHSIVSTNNGILVIRSESVKKTTKEVSRL